MPVVKMNVSLDSEVARKLKLRATERRLPASRYLAELIEADAKAAQDALAEEGYRLLGQDNLRVAEAALPFAAEIFPKWPDDDCGGERNADEG